MSSFVCMWWSECTDCYQQQWDKPFSKSKQSRKREKKTNLSNFVFGLAHFTVFSPKIHFIFSLSCTQAKPIDIYLFFFSGFFFLDWTYSVFFLFWNGMQCRLVSVVHTEICLYLVFEYALTICFFISEWHVLSIRLEILKYLSIHFFSFVRSFIRPVCQTDTDPNSNEIEPAHIDNGRRNSLTDRTKTEKLSPDDATIIQIIYGFKWLRSISIKIKKTKNCW